MAAWTIEITEVRRPPLALCFSTEEHPLQSATLRDYDGLLNVTTMLVVLGDGVQQGEVLLFTSATSLVLVLVWPSSLFSLSSSLHIIVFADGMRLISNLLCSQYIRPKNNKNNLIVNSR